MSGICRRAATWLVLSLMLVALSACAEPRILYQKLSAQGSIIVTEDEKGLRTLYFEPHGARQSVVKPDDPDHLELPYARAVLTGLALHPQPRRMLVVGLGGGTLPSFLRKHYPEAQIDVAEIDPEVARVAVEYFGFREDANMHILVGDGRALIEKARRASYDLIILDAYGADSIPMSLATIEFMRSVRQALAPGGLVVSNVWGRLSNPLYDDMVRTHAEAFDEVQVVSAPGSGNVIVMGLVGKRDITRQQLAQRARALAGSFRLRYDLGAIVDQGYVPPSDRPAGARVLRDAAVRGRAP